MSLKKYFAKKSVDDLLKEVESSQNFTRSMGAFQLIMLGLGAIIGAGIFVMVGPASAVHAGPAVVLSFGLVGLACACAGLCYAELASMIPISGSAYTFTYATLGEFPAWIVSNLAIFMYIFAAALIATGWSGYVVTTLADCGVYLPAQFFHNLGHEITLIDGSVVHGVCNLPAILIIAIVTMIVYRGAESAAIINTIIVAIKMIALFMFILIGASYIDTANWVPFIPENTGNWGEFGFSGIVAGASTVLLAFSGFDVVAAAAQETKNPKRNIPIGILVSLAISTIVYMLISATLTGIVKYDLLNIAHPVALAVEKMQLPWFTAVIKVGAITGLTSVILALVYAGVRVLSAVTNDGLLPQILNKSHKKHNTPYLLTILVGVVAVVISTLLPADILGSMVGFGIAATFSIVCFSTMYMRYKHPELPREFMCPLFPVVPLIGILIFCSSILSSISSVIVYLGIWLVITFAFYFFYSRKHSKLLNPSKN